jgi:hypothetical protein
MRFLIDANLPRAAIDVCQKFGHQVEFARDIGMAASPDEQIAERARASGAAPLNSWCRPEAAQQPPRDQAVAFLRRCLHFEPADDGGGSERSPRPWS